MRNIILPTRRYFTKVVAAALITSPVTIRRAEAMMRGGLTGANTNPFSDSDWPSPTNRPTWNSGTSTLSWVGPSGGGANNGNPVQQSRVLSASGSVSTTAANQVVQGLNITGTIAINHSGVTIKQCRVFDSGDQGTGAILINANITGLIIEDILMDGNKNSEEGINIANTRSLLATTKNTFRRNYFTGFENHITLGSNGGNNLDIIDNYFTACGNAGSPTFDGDMIECYACNNILIQHNQFDGSNSQTSNVVFNSMVNISNLSPVTNITCNDNLFSNCSTLGTFVLCDGPDFGGGSATFSWTNNGYYLLGGKAYQHGIPGTSYTITANSGNFTAATSTATSGVLINSGSGQI